MGGSPYLVDTNIIIGFFANEPKILEKVNAASLDSILVPSIVIGELLYGAELSLKADENIKKILMLAASVTTVDCSVQTAQSYSKIKSQLKRAGTPIPENDIWIAALAMQRNCILVTRDSHFNHIQNLVKERW